jgi:hypothetical protein
MSPVPYALAFANDFNSIRLFIRTCPYGDHYKAVISAICERQ